MVMNRYKKYTALFLALIMCLGIAACENGVCSYANLGEGFNTADCYWEEKMLGEQAHDGIREVEFDAVYCNSERLHPLLRQGVYRERHLRPVRLLQRHVADRRL